MRPLQKDKLAIANFAQIICPDQFDNLFVTPSATLKLRSHILQKITLYNVYLKIYFQRLQQTLHDTLIDQITLPTVLVNIIFDYSVKNAVNLLLDSLAPHAKKHPENFLYCIVGSALQGDGLNSTLNPTEIFFSTLKTDLRF